MAKNSTQSADVPSRSSIEDLTAWERRPGGKYDPTEQAAKDLGVSLSIGKGDLSQSPQAMRHGDADPYHYEGDVSLGIDSAPERAGKFEFQGEGGDQMYDVRKQSD